MTPLILEIYRASEIIAGVEDTLEDCKLCMMPTAERAKLDRVLSDVIKLKNDLIDSACEMEEENLKFKTK
jgi:hypothetical protein